MKSCPKKVKYKKQQRGSMPNRASACVNINIFNSKILLRAMEYGEISSMQLETLRKTLQKTIKKNGFFRILVFPDVPVTKKPLEIRMGKGKGAVNHWIAKIKFGALICTIQTSDIKLAREAFRNAQFRLPFKTKIINTVKTSV